MIINKRYICLPNIPSEISVILILWQGAKSARNILKAEHHINEMLRAIRNCCIPEWCVKSIAVNWQSCLRIHLTKLPSPRNHYQISGNSSIPSPLQSLARENRSIGYIVWRFIRRIVWIEGQEFERGGWSYLVTSVRQEVVENGR